MVRVHYSVGLAYEVRDPTADSSSISTQLKQRAKLSSPNHCS